MHDPATGIPANDDNYYDLRGVRITAQRISFVVHDHYGPIGSSERFDFLLRDLDPRVEMAGSLRRIKFEDKCCWIGLGLDAKDPPAVYNRVTDALLALKRAAQNPPTDEADVSFAPVAGAYRAASPKPAVPERARQLSDQAASALRDGNLDFVGFLYDRALDLAPWWPEAHFKRAEAFAATGEFPDAVVEMRRYLALTPDGPDAAAAQARVAEWGQHPRD
jgi:tetratricopeptide (TPR) repeat protein